MGRGKGPSIGDPKGKDSSPMEHLKFKKRRQTKFVHPGF